MEPLPYFTGFRPADSGPLARFLPAIEMGVVSAWLARENFPPGSWLLDPFGFSPRLPLEMARNGYRVLVTANNPIARFLLETFANPPAHSEFTAALADLAASKKGDERLGAHLQSLYLTACEKCGKQIQAQAFLWRKDAAAPYARVYECLHCGDAGERFATQEDAERAAKIAAADALHRARAYERVVSLKDEDRAYAEEAAGHYLPRPLYALTAVANRLESLNLSPERRRALTALLLTAFDAGNDLWAHPAERPRPKQLLAPAQFRENNIWLALEAGLEIWSEAGAPVPCAIWKNKIPESGGVLIYEGRLKDLARELKKEIPIAAAVGSIPRPNQAFWTLSALWAGWLWGKEAVEPYKAALRRRRYDWAWNAAALYAAFSHLKELLPEGVPFFALLPEPEPAYLTSAFAALSAAGFSPRSVALRTPHDPVQTLWKNQAPPAPQTVSLRQKIADYLTARGEPAPYLHLHAAGVFALAEANALKDPAREFDETLRKIHAQFGAALKGDARFAHYSSGEHTESGLWGLSQSAGDSLADQAEIAVVQHLQKNGGALFLEIENELNALFPGLLAPSKGLIYAILNSYAEKRGGTWTLRAEDSAAARRAELEEVFALLEALGNRLGYQPRRSGRLLYWEENGKPARSFCPLVSGLLRRALENSHADTALVFPGGRAALIAYKQERDPSLKAQMKTRRALKFRLLRRIAEMQMLTRDSFDEQIQSDPVEKSAGQMMLF